MNASCRNLIRTVKNRDGFTLIEMLIVIIILGILAMVIIPQISVSTDDAKVSTLKTNLAGLRSAIEIYYAQHGNVYPGSTKTAAGVVVPPVDVDAAKTAFLNQMTLFSDADGNTNATKTTVFQFGPYIKGDSLPANPYADKEVVCELTASLPVTRTPSGTAGWRYLPILGIIFANDAGTGHSAY